MNWLLTLHLFAVIPALVLGPFILFRKKGDRVHKKLGRIWVILILTGCLLSFGIRSQGSFNAFHALAAITILAVLRAIYAIRSGNRRGHQRGMIGAYLGLLTAFLLAVQPHRSVGLWMDWIAAAFK